MAYEITTEELKTKITNNEDYLLIDVLSPESYEARHVPTAVNIPNGPELVKKVDEMNIPKDREIIAYCTSATCGTSPAAAQALEKAGYTNVAHYKDGLAGWQDAGYDFE
ncbi:MAG: rhodanese-like domain-containing protein [Candidatus Saccharibacteria bacterium]|nr:rhodanese-like domain-containing protein [Candidatus Saccharibacteria bacterium]